MKSGGKVKAMVRNDILNGIAAYGEQQREILVAIERHGGRLHQDDFDAEFSYVTTETLPNGDKVQTMNRPRLPVWPMNDESFILGGMGDARSSSDWGKMLHLAQLMAQADLLRIKGKPPNVVYVANAQHHAEAGRPIA